MALGELVRSDLAPKKWTRSLDRGQPLELGRGEIPQRGVQPLSIVEGFDEVEHLPVRVFMREPAQVRHQLPLERAEETLLGGVVPAVALAGHAGDDAMSRQQSLVVRAGVLHAPIRVVDQPRGGPALGDQRESGA